MLNVLFSLIDKINNILYNSQYLIFILVIVVSIIYFLFFRGHIIIYIFIVLSILVYLMLLNFLKQEISFNYLITFIFSILFFIFIIFILYFFDFITQNALKNNSKLFLFFYYIVLLSIIVNILGISNSTMINKGKMNNLSNIFHYIFLYIPCYFVETVNKVNLNYKTNDTSKTTYLLIALLFFIIIIHYSYNLLIEYNNGFLVLKDKTHLDNEIINITFEELIKGKIKEDFFDLEEYERVKNLNKIKHNFNNLFKFNIFNKTNESNDILKKKKEDDDNLVNMNENKQISIREYGISFWLFLNPNIMDNNYEKMFIMSFSDMPLIYYDYSKQLLIIEYISKNINRKRLYATNKVLLQKWNHVVINYVNGTVDIFINDELISTTKNVTPYIHTNKLIVGSVENNNNSAISTFRFFNKPIPRSKINKLFKAN